MFDSVNVLFEKLLEAIENLTIKLCYGYAGLREDIQEMCTT